MDRYAMHGTIRASKIVGIGLSQHNTVLEFDDDQDNAMVEPTFLRQFNPQVGGYYVTFSCGNYELYIDAPTFAREFVLIEGVKAYPKPLGQNHA